MRSMMVYADLRPASDQDQLVFRRRALRDAVICIGWIKLVSTICYIILYFLVAANSRGPMSEVVQIMILTVIAPLILNGVFLFLGALEEKAWALEVALWLSLLLASYNTVLGITGAIYFIRTGHYTVHFMLAVIFGLLAISLCTVVCHDVLIIFSFKKLLQSL